MIPHNNIQIKVGGGNVSFPFFGYDPQKIRVKVGDSVTWIGTSMIEEPHTVSFVKDKAFNTGPDVPFMVSNSSTFLPVPSNANSQPTIIPNNNTTNKNNINDPIIIAGAMQELILLIW